MEPNPLLELEQELTHAAQRQIATVRRGAHPRWAARRTVLLAAAVLLVLAAAALAAVRLLKAGEPVPYRFGRPATAHASYGVAIPATMRLSAPVADPGGGLPWALRTFRTTRGYGCIELGRLYRGKIGILGQDSAFANDGRFHELRPGAVDDHGSCVALDARRHPYIALHENGLPASATGACTAKPFLPGTHTVPCPKGDLRDVELGFAGPDARSITYQAEGEPARTVPTGPDGAFLVVLPPQPTELLRTGGGRIVAPDFFSLTATPAARVLTKVTYRDGSVCHVWPTHTYRGGCPGHGPIPITRRLPRGAAIRTPLHLAVSGRGASAVLHVRFRARVAVTSGASVYDLIVKPEGLDSGTSSRTTRCRMFISQPIDRDVAVGEVVRTNIGIRRFACSGWFDVSLSYRVESGTPGPFGAASKYPGRLVARGRAFVP